MSVTLPITDLSTATVGTVGTVDWAAQLSAEQFKATADNAPHLWIFNESNCGLQLTFQSGEKPFLPAGGWLAVDDLNPTCLYYRYEVAYIMTGPLVTSLVTVWFGPDEATPNLPALGNSPIGGTSSVATSQILKGSSDSGFGVTSESALPLPTHNIEILLPSARNDGESTSLQVMCLDTNQNPNTPQILLDITSSTIQFTANGLQANGVWNQYNGETLAGPGVPVVVAVSGTAPTAVTTTAAVTLITYNPAAVDGFYRVNWWVDLANSVSGNQCSLSVSYRDYLGTARSVNLIALNGGASSTFNGINTQANGSWAGQPVTFWAKNVSSITVSYRDPTNTPGDSVYAMIEHLA